MVGVVARPEELLRWTPEGFLALVEAGLLPEGRGTELLDGLIVTETPPGPRHLHVFETLQLLFAPLQRPDRRIVAVPTMRLAESVVDPEFVLTRRPLGRSGLYEPSEVELVIEIAVTSRDKDLGDKAEAYARGGIPRYWVIDVTDRVLVDHEDPGSEGFRSVRRIEDAIAFPDTDLLVRLADLWPEG